MLLGRPCRGIRGWCVTVPHVATKNAEVVHPDFPQRFPARHALLHFGLLGGRRTNRHEKRKLAQSGRWSLTEFEEDDVSIIDLMLASANLLAASDEEHGVALSHNWSDVRREGLREARIRRAVAEME